MPESPLAAVVGRLVRGLPPADAASDAALLARFVGWKDEAAFELLVYRHGPMVRGVCRRVLRHEQDAEDAFQAAFLALARRAAAVRGEALAGWLYRVAFHAALKALARSARRDEAELPDVAAKTPSPPATADERETQAVLDEEVMRLPQRFRLPVVLCYLQGRSNTEAAAALGIPKGTVDSRLATARAKLRDRLVRRGVAPAAAAAAIESATTTAAEVPGPVARAMAKAAVAFLSHQPTAGVVPAAAAVLAEGVLHTMFVTKLKWAAVAALALAVLGSGAGFATFEALAGSSEVTRPAADRAQGPPKSPEAEAHKPQGYAGDQSKPATNRVAKLCEKLERTVTLEKPVENAPLRDVLEFLSDKYDITFIVDTQAFEQVQVGGGKNVEDSPVRLPKMPGVAFSTVLRFLTAQVEGTYLIRRDYIEITTRQRRVLEAFGTGSAPFEMMPPTVNVAFEGRPLDNALADVAVQSGKNIVLDPRVVDKEKLAVTAQMLNTPVESAVLVLADMVGLESVNIGNVYYVTTKDNAPRLRRRAGIEEPDPVAQPSKPAVK